MKDVVVVGDPFSGSIRIGSSIVEINGTWISSPQTSSTANGKSIIVEGSIGEYNCPSCGVPERIIAKSSSRLEGINGMKVHRVGDPIEVESHENISVVSTKGQSNVTSE